jgi:hypothetical protein
MTSKNFSALFDEAVAAAGKAEPVEDGPWARIRNAHAEAAPLVAQVSHPVAEGWAVEVDGLRGVLLREGAPREWIEAGPPAQVTTWVLSFSLDRAELRLVGFPRR